MTLNLSRLPWTCAFWLGIIFLFGVLYIQWSKKRKNSRENLAQILSAAFFVVLANLVRDDMKVAGFNEFQTFPISLLVYWAGIFLGMKLPNFHK